MKQIHEAIVMTDVQNEVKSVDDVNMTLLERDKMRVKEKEDFEKEGPNIYGDKKNLALLIFLYILQGVPLGLMSCIPMMLQKRGASYETQAAFTIVWWPFNLKILWAPIVDACYVTRFGRRKSWLVPMQYLLGISMIILSFYINQWLGNKDSKPNMRVIVVLFFCMTMMAATQDIAVDGWCLTLLKRRNVGYASLCQTLGQPIGSFLGFGLIISLESAAFCNTWLRSEPKDVGILSFHEYLRYWGIVFLVVTTLVALFKREVTKNKRQTDEPKEKFCSVIDTYKMTLNILNIRAIRELAAVLLTVRIMWAGHEGVAFLKFLNSGISNEKMIPLNALSQIPMQVLVSLLAGRYAAGSNPIRIYIAAIPFRTFVAIFGASVIWITPQIIPENGIAPNYIYFVYLSVTILYMFARFSMFTVITAFFVKISDPAVGGTYMTLLHSMNNMGTIWPPTLALWLVEHLTWRDCSALTGNGLSIGQTGNSTETLSISSAASRNSRCPVVLDGFFVETVIGIIFGLCWYKWGTSTMRRLQKEPLETWRVSKSVKAASIAENIPLNS